jgi:hypothetical protein
MLGRMVTLVAELISRRRLHWVEISIARAWSKDMSPRLFDLSNR